MAKKQSERKSGKRKRFVYWITPEGRKLFNDWLSQPTDMPVVRNELQLKLFLCANSPTKSLRLVEQYQVQQRAQLEEYRHSEEILRAALGGKDDFDELNEILAISARTLQQKRRQLKTFLMTLRHGIRTIEARLAWCEEVLVQLGEKN